MEEIGIVDLEQRLSDLSDIDLSGNYWGGNAPVENDDYYVEYSTRNSVIINDYLTSYQF